MNAVVDDSAAVFDIAVIGGGINGCGVARDAAGRGLSVFLVEQGDLASATSSASSKLIHGGIRYLEHYEFRLVREALKERDVLLGIAPHISRPMRFVFPHNPEMRPMWMIRAGLFLYDHLGGRAFPPSRPIRDFAASETGRLLKSGFDKAFEYSDCWVDDARLVVLNARDAADRGARILTRTRCISADSANGAWRIVTRDLETGNEEMFAARVLVNATGPWVSDFLSSNVHAELVDHGTTGTRKVKGSHLIVRKWFDHDRAYILQNHDRRIVFVLPFEDDYVLIGTTDVDYDGDPAVVAPSDEERDYLLACVADYFQHRVSPADVVGGFAGVRPLYDDGVGKAQEATRDYVLKHAKTRDGAGIVNVFGGKLTTYRRLAEAVLERVASLAGPLPKPWTARAALPGGDFDPAEREARLEECARTFPFLPRPLVKSLFRRYGLDVHRLVDGADTLADLGHHFGAGLYEAEVRWLVEREWARTSEDILWRRTKLGLEASRIDVDALDRWLAGRAPGGAVAASGTPR